MLAPDPTDWIVERTGPQVVLIAQNAIGRYVLTKPNKLLLASQYLAPAAIDRVWPPRPTRPSTTYVNARPAWVSRDAITSFASMISEH